MRFLNFLSLCTVFFLITNCKENTKIYSKKEANRPNIIFILADDFGIMDSQGYATKFSSIDKDSMFYETPNIDKLMLEGISFSQAYANQLCSPTRASLLTGKYAGRLGLTTAMPPRKTYYNQDVKTPNEYYIHDVFEHKDNIEIEQALINGISNSAIPSGNKLDEGKDELSIAEALKDYHSGFIGKWHIGGFGAKGYQPEDQGFEPIAWFDAGGSPYYDWKKLWNAKSSNSFQKLNSEETFDIGDSGEPTSESYLTDDLTNQALNFIEKQTQDKTKPFFLYFSHFAIHSPYEGIEAEVDYFKNKPTKGWNNHKDPVYASMIKSLDRSIGSILNKLEELNIEENTLVVFMSDNGGIDSKITPKGDGTDNSPFLGGKACLTEGGIRVPLVFRWKGNIDSKKWVNTPVDCTDIFPSLLEAAGYNAKEVASNNNLDGVSLISLLYDTDNKNSSYTKTTHFWHYPFNVIYNSPYEASPLTPHSAIRHENYKLIYDWYGRLYLYNIENDPFEKVNLAEGKPKLTSELFNKLMHWLQKNVDKRYWPSINLEYNEEKEVRTLPFIDLFSKYN